MSLQIWSITCLNEKFRNSQGHDKTRRGGKDKGGLLCCISKFIKLYSVKITISLLNSIFTVVFTGFLCFPPSSDLRTLPTSSWNRLMAKNYHFCHRLGRDILYRWKMSHQTPCSMWWLVDSFPIGKQTKFVSFWFGLFRSNLRSTFCHVVSAPVIRWYSPVHLKLLSCRPLSLTSYMSPTKVSFSSNWELAWKPNQKTQ